MNKTELVAAVAAKAEISKKDATSAVDSVLDVITAALADGDKIQIAGFGSFEVKDRAARKGLNPRTKEVITIAASKAPVFKAGKGLKDAVAKK